MECKARVGGEWVRKHWQCCEWMQVGRDWVWMETVGMAIYICKMYV